MCFSIEEYRTQNRTKYKKGFRPESVGPREEPVLGVFATVFYWKVHDGPFSRFAFCLFAKIVLRRAGYSAAQPGSMSLAWSAEETPGQRALRRVLS